MKETQKHVIAIFRFSCCERLERANCTGLSTDVMVLTTLKWMPFTKNSLHIDTDKSFDTSYIQINPKSNINNYFLAAATEVYSCWRRKCEKTIQSITFKVSVDRKQTTFLSLKCLVVSLHQRYDVEDTAFTIIANRERQDGEEQKHNRGEQSNWTRDTLAAWIFARIVFAFTTST